MNDGTPALVVRGLIKLYGTVRAVQELSFEVAPGEVVGLVGPNGAGKTTTLRCVAGIIPPTHGDIQIAGSDLLASPVRAKRARAVLPDEPRLFDFLTVREHLNFTARLYEVPDWERRAESLLDELELLDKQDRLPGELSRGMKQKLSIACGLLHDPRVILLDEPLTGLDPLGIRKMKRSISERAQAGAAVVLSSHLLPLVEELCHRVLVISSGKRVAFGTLEEIRGEIGTSGTFEDVFVRITAAEGG